jgi:L-lactate dehydrogenase complex protein LldE
MKVALFVTCFNDTMFPESAKATVELLERLGVDVGGRVRAGPDALG